MLVQPDKIEATRTIIVGLQIARNWNLMLGIGSMLYLIFLLFLPVILDDKKPD